MKVYVVFLEWEITSLENLYKVVKEEDPYNFVTLFSIRDIIEDKKEELRKAKRKMFYMKKFDKRNR